MPRIPPKLVFRTHSADTNTHVASPAAGVSDRSGGSREKCPLGVLITALRLPFAVTVSRGGQDKSKAMFHLCCLAISNSEGSKRIETACYYSGGRPGTLDASLFSPVSLYLPPFAAVFKISHYNKSALMASRQWKKAQLDYCDSFI